MSGSSITPAPRDDAEWARDIVRRIEALERPSALRAGDWVITTSPETGNLIASHVDGGSVVIAPPPPSGQDPDAVVDTAPPALQMSLIAPGQNLASNTVARVQWNRVDRNIGGWQLNGLRDATGGDGSTATDNVHDIVVPSDDLYLITVRVSWQNAADRVAKVMLHIDDYGVDVVESRWPNGANVTPTLTIATQRWLTAGTAVGVNAWSNTAGLLSAPSTDAQAHPTLTITALRG